MSNKGNVVEENIDIESINQNKKESIDVKYEHQDEMDDMEYERIKFIKEREILVDIINKRRNIEKRSAKWIVIYAPIFVITMTVISSILALAFSTENYVSKDEIQKNIILALTNEGDLRAVKHIYNNRSKTKKGFSELLGKDVEKYNYEVPLSIVLEDIRTDIFLSKADKTLFEKMEKIIKQHTQINPFDKLEQGQRDYFENIKIKLDEDYSIVMLEINKIAGELDQKNALVGEYLKDSKTSFWISVTALIFSFFISFYQLYTGRTSKIQRLMTESVSEVLVGINERKSS